MLFLGAGCNYISDRGKDFLDCFQVNAGPSLGVVAHVKVTSLGGLHTVGFAKNIKFGTAGRFVGTWKEMEGGLPLAVGGREVIQSKPDGPDDLLNEQSFLGVVVRGANMPHILDIGVGATAGLVSARITLSPLQFLDFVIGWSGLDPAWDDHWNKGKWYGAVLPKDPEGVKRIHTKEPLDALYGIFSSSDPFTYPFQDQFDVLLLYPTEGYHLNKEQYRALIKAARAVDDSRFFLTLGKYEGGSFRSYHDVGGKYFWCELPLFEAYAQIHSFPVGQALYSPSGKWGILTDHEGQHAIVGGTEEFMKRFKETYPEWESDLSRLKERWKKYPRIGTKHPNADWIEKILRKGSIRRQQETGEAK
jgi:hypothetical protein